MAGPAPPPRAPRSAPAGWKAAEQIEARIRRSNAKRPGVPRNSANMPAIPITARTGEGVHTLLATVAEVIEGQVATKPIRVNGTPEFQKAVHELAAMIEQMSPGIPNARWLAIRLLDGDARVQQAITSGELNEIVARQQRADVQFSGKMSVEGRQ